MAAGCASFYAYRRGVHNFNGPPLFNEMTIGFNNAYEGAITNRNYRAYSQRESEHIRFSMGSLPLGLD
jgi:hypothetical protein